MKTSVSRRLLSFALILCMIIPMLPVIEFTASSASTPTYIASIGITQKGSAGDAKSALSGHTIIDRDLNEGASGDYVYMGYKTTSDPYQAITGIVFRVGKNPPASISYGSCTFYLVGGSEETNTSSQGGWIDLNGAAGGDYIYTYVTRDHNYGAPLTTMTVDESSSKSGYSTGTNTSGTVIDLNQEAGGKYLYLHYKRFSATVKATYHYLNANGNRTNNSYSLNVKNHLEALTTKPSYPTSVTYDGRTFTFKGWREDNTAGAATVTSPSATYITGDKTYRAVYAANVTLSYDANGGNGAPSAQSATQYINAGSSSVAKQSVQFTISNNAYPHSSNCFLGWSSDKSATTATYQPDGKISISGNTTLYAVYADHTYNNGICERCGAYIPDAFGVVSKNGQDVFAGATLREVHDEAVKYAAEGNVVLTLLKNYDLGTSRWVFSAGVFTLDLNGFELKSSNSNGVLHLKNPSVHLTLQDSGKTGKITGAKRGIGLRSGSTVTINGGTITADTGTGVNATESSTVTINGGTITADTGNGVNAIESSTVTINGGTITSDTGTGVHATESSTVTINGGTISGDVYSVYATESSTVNISDGTFSCRQYGASVKYGSTLTISGGAFTGNRAVYVTNNSTVTISGGSFSGGTYDIHCESNSTARLTLGQSGTGATFPGGFTTASGSHINDMLDTGCAYWAGDTMLEPADNAYLITDKGDITVKAACTHSSFTKQNYVNNGDYHTYTRSCCKTTVTEDHTFVAGNCICGLTCSHASGFTNGFCIENGCYQPAELVDGYYQIANGGNLFWFAEYINTVDRTASAKLTANIDLENRPWTPIGSTGETNNNFRGHFDGQGYTITGLNVNANRAGAGFFGEVRLGTVENFTIYGNVTVTANNITYVGGVIGSAPGANSNQPDHNGATIRNITSYVNVTVEDDKTGVGRIGGFIGYANHETIIENCAWYGTIDLGNQAMTLGAGGFIGRVNENSAVTIRNCGAYGSIVNDSVTENVGAFMGLTSTGTNTVIENCLFAGSVSGTNASSVTPFGTWNGASKTLTNSYYINTLGTTDADAAKVTADQLASGEIACKLGSAWGQTIGTEDYPVLGGEKVYQVCNCKNETAYSNTDADTDHAFGEDGKCTACGALLGDVSGEGKLTALDLALINAYVKEKIALTPEVLSVADFDRDGFVTSADVDSLKDYILYN